MNYFLAQSGAQNWVLKDFQNAPARLYRDFSELATQLQNYAYAEGGTLPRRVTIVTLTEAEAQRWVGQGKATF